uniref:NADH dehydrogenase subunit 5 n=1 Tax=Goniurosaurus bawanglingensis TaxID=2234022 RepID=UPI002A7FFE9D|nr:NADH dehydrogenase subunit 5 [Goniurosaurus bawanglingensis]WOA02157.1 NADH dehydrogenase subunit 5 [Goniurosaurus bawanglingensis]
MQTLLFHTTILMTLALLLAPLFTCTLPLKKETNAVMTTKLAFLTSLVPTLIFFNTGLESTTMNFNWLNTYFNIKVSFMFDQYTTTFLPVALFVTWAILEFTNWYMTTDKNLNQFTKYLMMFLISMLLLITANSLFQLFIGWEAVGIMSFLLIGWWSSRSNANTSALQAVIFNRMGDIGLILALAWFSMNSSTWDISQMFSQNTTPLLPLLGLILAATGKSAQFGLHPWLPAAMEGPTPVSALLHSSTMVVAGIFLLIRLNPLLYSSTLASTICLCLGATTTVFTAICALTQNDLKKIIAFSTSSQLGLMMVAIGLKQPELAFFHIMTHAFFKAMLFLCSGSIIHCLLDEQDIRKMGGTQMTLPITTSCMTLGGLALTGTPFLAGYYSKDPIIEAINTSNTNAWALMTTLIATSLTAAYSLRIIFYVQMKTPRHMPTTQLLEVHQNQTSPLMRLAAGSMITGLFIINTMIPKKLTTMTMTTPTKLAALLVTLVGLLSALELANKTTLLTTTNKMKPNIMSTQLLFFNTIMHRKTTAVTLNSGHKMALQLNDLLWYEKLGPNMLATMSINLSNKLSSLQKGIIKTYLTTFSTLSVMLLLLTKVYTTR